MDTLLGAQQQLVLQNGQQAAGGQVQLPQQQQGVGACQTLVFNRLSVDCNLQLQGTVQFCCASLARINEGRCLCIPQLHDAMLGAITESGLAFFDTFAQSNCGMPLLRKE
eukprot:9480759-Pyramimonas_sp.AAC.1